MMAQTFELLAPLAILPSLTNPRKHFDAARLQELADSIKASGVHQPVLVRPLPAERVPDTAGMSPRPTHELVIGERRWRASQIAGIDALPAVVRELADAQVLEIQVIENLQRDDLTPLEEADGYDQLRQIGGLNADQIAAKIGKSRAYVYARMKLLDLGQEGRAALAVGKLDASRALLLARIPSTELQAQALKKLLETDYYGQPMSARRATEYIQRDFMARLNDARWKKDDAALVPAAGACKDCPKRSGANPDLFADVKGADVCTDVPCYRAKEQAHQARELQAARDRGATIIEGREAKELMPHSGTTRVEGYLRLDDKFDSPTGEPLRNVLKKELASGEAQPIMIANPHKDGELVAVLKRETVADLLAKAGQRKAYQSVQRDIKANAEADKHALEREAKIKFEQGWRTAAVAAVKQFLDGAPGIDLSPVLADVMRYCAAHFAGMLTIEKTKPLAKLLELGKVAPRDGVRDWVREHANPAAALLLLVAYRDSEYSQYAAELGGEEQNKGLRLVADGLKIDLNTVKREFKVGAKPAAPASADSPAARARGKRGAAAPKLSEEDARTGIADAMQSEEAPAVLRPPAEEEEEGATPLTLPLSVGQRIRIAKKLTEPFKHYAGRTGTVAAMINNHTYKINVDTGGGKHWPETFNVSSLRAAGEASAALRPPASEPKTNADKEWTLKAGQSVRVRDDPEISPQPQHAGCKGVVTKKLSDYAYSVDVTVGNRVIFGCAFGIEHLEAI